MILYCFLIVSFLQIHIFLIMKRTTLTFIRLLRPLLHAMVILVLFYAMVEVRQTTDLIPFVQLRIPQIDIYETMLFALISAGIFVVIWLLSWIYELIKPLHAYYRKFLRVRGLRLVSSSFIAYIWFGYLFHNGISRFVLLTGVLSTGIVLTLIDLILNIWNGTQEKKHPYQVLLLSSDKKTSKKIKNTLHLYPMYMIEHLPLSRFSKQKIQEHDIVMIAGTVDKKILQKIADKANIHNKLFYHVGDTLFLEDLIAQPQRIGPLVALQYKSSPLDGWRQVIKRIFDILGAFLWLLILSPFFLIIALIIKSDTRWPIFYIQERIGRNKQKFPFIKFRSMYTHLSTGENYGGKQAAKIYQALKESKQNVRKWVLAKIEDDPRITPVWRFLRKTSLDELPSLRSVLKGDMSLVWPRPHMPDEVNKYDKRQERLFSIKPWITWYAQIFGRDKLSFDEEARLDLYYIQNRSLFLDIYVLVSTIKVVFSGR